MAIKFYNTLTKKIEVFEKDPKETVGMYNCGPTVYDYVHIGNLRSYVFSDTIRRVLEGAGYKVNQVINLTDIGHLKSDADTGEDKMMIALRREGKPITKEAMKEIAVFYRDRFVEDIKSLNILFPTHLEFASDHVFADIELIKKLDNKGYVYTTSDGVYFDTKKYPDYGILGGLNLDKEQSESRIGENSEKRNPSDFALWKFNTELGYESPWGAGFPGWHIECSAMSMEYLGETFDIHTGGIDHIPVHHNNEIAQSVCATGHDFAHIWMHNAFVTLGNDAKMAKSLGNSIKFSDIKDAGINPLAYRLWLLTAHYRKEVTFSWDALCASDTALSRIYAIYDSFNEELELDYEIKNKYLSDFISHMENDLDTPGAIASMWEMLKDPEINEKEKMYSMFVMDKYLGLGVCGREKIEVPAEVLALVKERDEARKNNDFKLSDELRDKIQKLGFAVKDTKDGTEIRKNS